MKQLIFLLAFLFILVACDKKDDQPFDITATRLNIADAKMLALCGSGKTRNYSAHLLCNFHFSQIEEFG